jgi:RND family efflux transporter MFP subunit
MQRSLTHIILSITLIGVLNACSNSESETSGQNAGMNAVVPSVEAVQSRYGALPLVERFSGNVRAENQVPLFSEISGVIEQVFVKNGAKVVEGTALAKLNTNVLEKQLQQAKAGYKINSAQLKQAKARLTEVQARHTRMQKLAKKDLTSALEIEQMEAQLLSAEADVELAEARLEQASSLVAERNEQLKKAVIRAPITGTIGQRNAEVGMQVSSGTQLFLIGDLSKLKVEIVLTENMLNKIDVGQSARIILTNNGEKETTIEAKLSRISPFLNERTRSTEAEIDVENVDGLLRPGMFVPVDIYFGESEQATLIPVSALYTDPTTGQEGVFVATSLGSEIEPVSDSSGNSENTPGSMTAPTSVEFKPIQVLAQGRMEYGVSGLESGQWIVTVGQDLLSEGRTQARIRTMSWDRIYQLQQLQREDLLKEIMQERDKDQNNVSL